MGISLDPTGILSLIAIIAGAQVSNAYGVGPRPTGIFTADPNHRRQPQPTGILTTDPNHRSKILQPTGIIAADPTGVFALDPSSNRHRRFGGRGLNPTEIITGPLDPTGTYRNQLKPTGIHATDPTYRRGGRDVGLDGLEPTGVFALDPNPNPAPGITIYPVGEDGGPDASSPTYIQPDGTVVVPDLVPKNKRHAQPDPTFGVPDGIYPASVGIPDGIYPAGVTSYSRALQPTGIYSAGGTSFSSHTLKPTGIFTTGVTTHSRPLRPTGIFATGGSTYNRPLRPTGIFTVG